MAHRSRRRLYETAFDSKVEKPSEEGSVDLLDRIANHPILLLLNPRRRSRQSNNNNPSKQSTAAGQNLNAAVTEQPPPSVQYAYHGNPAVARHRPATVLPKAKFQGSGTPRCGRRGARARICPPPRSLSSHHLLNSSLRPIGLSKSDDQILNRVSDSPDDEDYFEDYVEGQQAEDLARDLITLHLNADESRCPEACGQRAGCSSASCECRGQKPRPGVGADQRQLRKAGADRGMSRDGKKDDVTCSWDCINDNCRHHLEQQHFCSRNKNDRACPGSTSARSSSILALHHPNVSSPRMQHHERLLHCSGSSSSSSSLHHSPLLNHPSSASSSPRIYCVKSDSSSLRQLSYSASPSPKLSTHSSSASSSKLLQSCNTPSPRLLKSNSRAPNSALSSPRLLHLTSSGNTDAFNLSKCISSRPSLSTSGAIARVLQGPPDCSSAPTIISHPSSSSSLAKSSKLSIDEPSTSGYSSSRVSPSAKTSLRDLKRSEGLAKLKPLELHSPPGTAPLPIKFIKKPPLSDRSPSSWFSPPRQKDLSLPIKRSNQSRSSSSDASTSDCIPSKSRLKKLSSSSSRSSSKEQCRATASKGESSSANSESSLNSSMEVLVDTVSESGFSLPAHAGAKTSSLSLDSMASGISSMESLKSSVSEGATSTGWWNLGSNSSLPLRPSLLLPATHRSLIQSAKFQILSPISDKSQEPSSTDTGGPIVGGTGVGGGGSQHTSPQDLLQQTPLQSRNIPEDFRNVHHILPGPLSGGGKGQPGGSDSGISIEYDTGGHLTSGPCVLKDLPFDMPKLRRRLAAARSCPSTSDSSLASSGDRHNLLQPAPLPASLCTNPAISRVQASEILSGTSSSNSSLWEAGSSAASSTEGTPRKGSMSARGSLVLDLGFSALAMTGEEVDVTVPLTKQSWYHGKINRSEAEQLLRCETEGAYLVRSIDTPRMEYSLALKAACGYMHLKIQFHAQGNGFKMGKGDQLFPSVPHIVHHHSIHRLPFKGTEHMFLVKPIISETL